MTDKIPVCILVRVSTIKQETARQITELRTYAASRGYTVIEECKETVSGRADESERAGLQRAMHLALSGQVKKVLVHEVSRLARKNSVVHRFVELLDDSGVSLYWHSQGFESLLPNGKPNPASRIMLALLSEMARAEVETLRERINSGLAEAKRNGVVLGRPKGSGAMTSEAFLRKHRDVVRLLQDGQSPNHVAKITGKGLATVKRVRAALTKSKS